MPTYDYECTRCGRMIEEYQSITAKPKRTLKVDCDKCNNRAPVRRCIGKGAGVIFKGSGFYQTDYRSAEYTKQAKAEKEGGKKTESKDGSDKKTGTDKKAGSEKTSGGGSTKTDEKKSEGSSPKKKTDG